jgi:hypothetical protein
MNNKIFEVCLTAPQIELSNGTIAMFWFPDTEINAGNSKQAEEKVQKMIDNNEIDVDIMDKDGCSLTNMEYKEAYNFSEEFGIKPEIDRTIISEDKDK